RIFPSLLLLDHLHPFWVRLRVIASYDTFISSTKALSHTVPVEATTSDGWPPWAQPTPPTSFADSPGNRPPALPERAPAARPTDGPGPAYPAPEPESPTPSARHR